MKRIIIRNSNLRLTPAFRPLLMAGLLFLLSSSVMASDFSRLSSAAAMLSVQIEATDVLCHGDENGTLSVDVDGGTAPYTYLWNTGATSSSLSGMAPGVYLVTVTDATGASADDSAKIEEPEPLTIETSSNYETCEGSADAHAAVNADGGTGQRTYVWSNGMTGYIIEGISAGSYTVTVTDENGCSAVATEEVELSPEGVWIMTSSTDVTCPGGSDGTAHVGAMTGEAPYTYLWSDPAMQTSDDAVDLIAGTYFVTVTDNNGCTAIGEVTIDEPAGTPLTVVTSSSYATCDLSSDASATAEASGGTGAHTYLWSNGMTGFKIEDIPAGIYTVTVTDEAGCTAVATEEVELSPEGVWIDLTATDVTCPGGNDGTAEVVATTGEPPYTYLWNDPAMQTTSVATNLSSGTYEVTVTDSNGCSAVGSISVNGPSGTPLTVVTSSSFATCNLSADAFATAEASGGTGTYTYLWNDPNSQTGATATNLAAGTYTVTVTDGNGCTAVATEEVELSPEGVLIDLTATDVTCHGGNDGTAEVVATTGEPPYTYLWNDPAMQTTSVAVNLSGGTYEVTVTDSNGCSAVGSINVNEPTAILITTSTTNASCDDDGTATAETSGGTGTYTYLWNDSNSQTGATATNLAEGTYTVTVTDSNDCTATQDVIVGRDCTPPCLAEAGTLSIDAASVCLENGSATLSASPNGDQVVPAGYSVLYVLTTGTDLSILQTNTDPGFTVSDLGNYTIHALVYDPTTLDPSQATTAGALLELINNQGLCADLDVTGASALVEDCGPNCQTPVVESVVIIEPTCENQDGRATVNVFGGPAGFSFTWTPNVSTTHVAENISAGVYTVLIQDLTDPTCPIIEETFTVANANGPEVEIAATTPATCQESNGTASLLPFGLTYQWCSGETGNNATNLPAGECQVTVTDPMTGCIDVIEVVIDEVNPLLAEAVIVQQPTCNESNGAVDIVVSNGSFDYSYLWEDGSMMSSRTDLAAGMYLVTVTDNGPTGCERIVSFTLTDDVPQAMVSVEPLAFTSCPGTSDAMAVFTIDYGIGFVQPADTQIVDVNGMTYTNGELPVGNYCIEIQDGNGCAAGGACFEVQSPDQIDVDVAIFDKDCVMDGSITLVDVHGGNGGYTFDWMDLPGNDDPQNRTNLNAGTYTVIVTDAKGCSVTVSGLVVEDNCCDNPPVITNVIVFEASCGASDGRAEILLAGNVNDYLYTWSPSVSLTNFALNIPTGTYSVTITDINDATCFLVHSFTVGTRDGPTATVTTTPATCSLADGTATLSPANYTYNWSDSGTGANRTDLTAGFYSVTVTDPDQPNCEDIITVLIEEQNPLTVEVQINSLPDCGVNNGSVTLNVNGGSGNYSFNWGAGASRDDLTSGAYTVIVSDVLWGCDQTVSFILNDNVPGLSIDLTTIDITCTGAQNGAIDYNLTLENGFAEPATTVILQNGQEQTNGELSPGEYCLEVRDANGCVAGGECFEINEPSQLDVDVAILGASCDTGGSIGLEVTGSVPPYSFNWTDLPGTDDPEDRVDLMAGVYEVSITDANGCNVVISDIMVDDECECVPPVVSSVVVVEATCGNTDGRATVNVAGGPDGFVYTWAGDISTTHQAFDLPAGTYAVTISDPSDATCMVEETFTIGNSNGPAFDLTTVDANCGVDDGVAVFSPGSFTYQWSVGGQGSFRSDLAPGMYQVTIIDPADPDCFDVQTVVIGETNSLEIDYTVVQLPDCNTSNGIVTLIVDNGSGNYEYSWGDDATMSNLSSGVYTVTVTDMDTDCENTLTFALDDNVSQANIMVQGVPEMSCPGANDGAIQFDLSGNFAEPATVEIRDAFGNVYTNGSLAAGNYCLVVVDANACIAGSNCFVIKDPEQLDVDIAITPETCVDLGTIQLVSVTGGTGVYTYAWSDGNNIPDPTFRTELSGDDYGLTVTDDNGCAVSEILNVNDFAYNVMVSLDPSDVSCFGENDGNINSNVVNAAQPLTFDWEHGPNTADLTDLPPGTYTVTVTDANQCSGMATTTITEPQMIDLQLPEDTTICDASMLVVASVNVSDVMYTWTDVDGMILGSNSVLLVEPDSASMIFLEVVDSLGCSAKDSIEISDGNAAINTQGPTTTCVGTGGTQVSVSNLKPWQTLTYNWSPASAIISGGDTANPTVATETEGSTTYVVEVENEFGCMQTDSVTLTVIDTTSIPDVITSWMCDELTVNFEIDDDSGMNYVLNFGDPMHPDSTTTDLESSYTYSTTGTYTITLSVPGTEACMMPLEKEIEVLEAPFIQADFTYNISACSDSAVIELMDNSSSVFGPVNSWSWSFSNNTTASGTNPTLVLNNSQQLGINLMVTNEFGCEASISDSIPIEIIVLELPDTIPACPNDPTALNPGAPDNLVYSWTPSTYLNDANIANPVATAPEGTIITYELTVMDSAAICMKTAEVTLVVSPEMTNLMVSDDQFVCESTPLTLSASSTEAVAYTWFDQNNMVVSNAADYTATPGGVASTLSYVVELRDANGCALRDTVEVSNAAVELMEPLETPELCLEEEVTLFAEAFTLPGSGLTYSWTPSEGIVSANADSSEIVIRANESMTYTYVASNDFGCSNRRDIDILVSDITVLVEATTDRDTVFRGQVAQLNATRNENYLYNWDPAGSLSDETISNPQATPEETTDYGVVVTDEAGCSAMASVRVTVLNPDCDEPFLFFPNAFTPNNDGFNDVLYLRAPFEVDEVYFVIYSRWGEKVFESNSLDSGWDGTFKGEILVPDVYGFYLRVRCGDGDLYTRKGNVTLLR